MYQPNAYESEALTWAIKQVGGKARGLADSVEELTATYHEIRAEGGRYGDQCEFTQRALGLVDVELREAFRQLNSVWARGYAAGCNS